MKFEGLVLKHILTDYDNETYDTGRVLAFFYFLSAVVFMGWSVIHLSQPFDAQAYLVGGGGFLGGLGVYLFGDNTRRPHHDPSPDPEVPKG